MRQKEPGDDKFACFICNLNLDGLTGTRIILWLVAITIVSFVIGFGILAVTGDLPSGKEKKGSLFLDTGTQERNTTIIPLEGASSGEIRVLLGAGELSVEGGAPVGQLMVATVYSRRSEMQPDFTVSTNNSVRTVDMTETGHKKKDWVLTHTPESWANSWDMKIGNEVPVAMTVNLGAGDCDLLLGTTNLSSLTVNSGAGEMLIDLGDYHGGRFDGRIHNGVGDVTIRVPANSNTRLSIHQGVGDISSSGFVQYDEFFTTPGFNSGFPSNQILVEQGVGDISLEAV